MEASTASQSATKKGQANPFVNDLLVQAQELATEKEELYERIGANRTVLRQVAKTGLLSKAQADSIEEFYPTRKKGEDEAESNGGESS